jgi:HAE1 family hydrophobic/amphiphilic exporter-1
VNLSESFIRRPVMTTLVMLSILLFGVLGYRLLPVSDLPNVDFPTIFISASLPGANPDTMAATVATPLEKEFSTIAGVDSMSSTSTSGATQITVTFVLSRNIDAAAQDVQAAIARALRKLPVQMTTPPSYRKVNPADAPILWMALTSPYLPMSKVDDLGENMMAQRISQIDGVAQVQVYGAQKYAVRVQADPAELASRGIGIDEMAGSISDNNINIALGTLYGPDKLATVQANGQLYEAKEFLPLIVTMRNGQPVRLADVGTAVDSVENNKQAAWFTMIDANGSPDRQRSVVLVVQRQPGTNTVEVANAVKALLPTFRSNLPAAARLEILRDASVTIKESANDVQFTLLLTLVLVVLVIFLFLRNLSATVIPSLTLPMAIIGTFALMYVMDYSLDNLSLMALTLSVGFVVDDAVVMLENIVRHMEMGKPRFQAALDASKEIGFTIVSMTLSLAAVFLPFLLMGGILGRLFREFSVTIGIAVMVSGIVSLTLTPMLASRFLRDSTKIRHNLAYRITEAGFDAILNFYSWTLRVALRHRLATVFVSLAILVGTGYLAVIIPKGFIPSEDRDQLMIQTEASQNISFDGMIAHQQALMDVVDKNPNVDRFMSAVGGFSGVNGGRMFLALKPKDQRPIDPARGRPLTADEIITQLRAPLEAVPGMRCSLSNPLPINIGGRMTKATYQLTLQGVDTAEVYRYCGELEDQVRAMPEVTDVSSDMQLKCPQINVKIDRDQAKVLGVTPMQIETALELSYSTFQASTIYTSTDQYQVILELDPNCQTDPTVLSKLYIRAGNGQLIPLDAVASRFEDVGPLAINHSGQLPSVTISFNLKPGVSLGEAVDKINAVTHASMPAGMTSQFQGTASEFGKSMSSMGFLLILAVVVIYVVLGILYESFIHPLTILSALPFAGFGALLTLYVFHCELTIYAFVGIIMLVGLVKKNGIMMVDFAIEAQNTKNLSPQDAIYEACRVRFRPIMMTTMAALVAGIPIAAGYGAGAESRQPLGLAVVGGLLFSQTLTLYVTPVIYVYMEKLRHALSRAKAAVAEVAPPIAQTLPASIQ